MKKFTFMFIGLLFAIEFIGFAEIKSLRYKNGYLEEDPILCAYYIDEDRNDYFTEDEIAKFDKPIIYFESLDYVLNMAMKTYFDKKHDQRLIEVVLPILKKYKYVMLSNEGYYGYCCEYFLIGKNKIFGRFWYECQKEE